MKNQLAFGLSFSRALAEPELIQAENLLEQVRAFVQSIEQAKQIKLSVFFSGFILEIIQELMPELLQRLSALANQGQLEILSGFFFEPKLSLLTADELNAHLELTAEFWSSFGVQNLKGIWLPQQPWPEALPKVLADSGCSFVVIDKELLSFDSEHCPTHHIYHIKNENSPLSALCKTSLEKEQPDQDTIQWLLSFIDQQDSARAAIESPQTIIIPDLSKLLGILSSSENSRGVSRLSILIETLSQNSDRAMVLFNELINQDSLSVSASLSNLPLPAEPNPHSSEAHLNNRMIDLRRELLLLPEQMNKHPHYFANQERLQLAKRWFLRFQYRPLAPTSEGSAKAIYAQFRESYLSLLHANVEADVIKHPEIEPAIGWIDRKQLDYDQDGEEEVIVDTPFMRLYFKPSQGASLVEFDYKPRKINLLNTAGDEEGNYSFTGMLFSQKAFENGLERSSFFDKGLHNVIRQSPDMLISNFVQPLRGPRDSKQPSASVSLHKHFTVKAGLGAHLTNATTGLSLEYWLEAKEDLEQGLLFAMECIFMLPSGNPEGMSARPLLCVGGEGERTYSLSNRYLLKSEEAPGGIYGVRLIDGIEGFIIELRLAKPVLMIETQPLYRPTYSGTAVRFISEAKHLLGDSLSNILFLSIP